MKLPFDARAPTFDADAIHATIQRAFASAGLDTRAGPMHGVTETLRRALGAGRPGAASPVPGGGSVIDVDARVVPPGEAPPARGRFEAHVFSSQVGSRAYKVHVPAGSADAPRALLVMLHGCTQSADDFAAGTQMNRLADEHGFLVVYPEQSAQANASRCWNWFKPQDQTRGAGEPALVAGIVGEVARRHAADPRRIFVAGLSAGAAMAVVLGETYPELFAGVGAHSGLPYGSAHDVPSALAAMKGGRGAMPGPKATRAVPVIVFHGDRDHTVQYQNGIHIERQAREAHDALAGDAAMRVQSEAGVAAGGRRYSRTVHVDADGQVRVESWTVHGAGHAWSGGHASGTHTDPSGPDASAEMVRFFLALPRPGSA